MRRLTIFALALLAGCGRSGPAPVTPSPPAPAVGGPPATDIYLYVLERFLPFGNRLSNVTNRLGYDNQPAWDGPSLLYTAWSGGQTDIYRFRDGVITRVTNTPESEYSAAVTPDGNSISVIRVERDSTQRLWRFPLDSSPPSPVLENIKPVGYFAWLDSTLLALFVLGNPNTLQIADTRTGTAKIVTTNIGRSLQRVPMSRKASYIHRVNDRWKLETVDPRPRADGSFAVDTITILPDSADYVVWKSPTEIYTASGSRIFRMRLPKQVWEQVADLERSGIRRISRIAISPDGKTLALVADEPAP